MPQETFTPMGVRLRMSRTNPGQLDWLFLPGGPGIGSESLTELVGVPFERRTHRMTEYVEAMRTIWREDVATFNGEFASFHSIRVNPKPVRSHEVPVVFGGNSDAALRRVGRLGEGWYGFNLDDVDRAAERVSFLRAQARQAGRDPVALRISVALRDPQPDDLPALAESGVDELVLVESPPGDPAEATAWIENLSRRWLPEVI